MREDYPAVSVLLPVFFRDSSADDIRLLRRALASIREQEFRSEYEVLLLDDGSEMPVENLRCYLGENNLKNVRFVRNQRNQGLVYTLNRGLSEARFPLIARLDADDRWLPSKISKQLELFAEDGDLTITATGMTFVDLDEKPLQTYIRPADWDGILSFFIDVGCPFPHGSVVARRDIYLLLGGYSHHPGDRHCEDYTLWGHWLRFFKPAMIEEALYYYTVSDSSVSATHAVQQRQASREVNRNFRNLNVADQLSGNLSRLAESLECSILEVGMLAYKIWRSRLPVRLPETAVEILASILPDRVVTVTKESFALPLEKALGRQIDVRDAGCVTVRAM